MTEDRPKFAQAYAHTFVQEHLEKPFFGKPYMKRGVYWGGCAFAFQQLGLLGRLYSDNQGPFVYAMSADKGDEENVLDFLESGVTDRVLPYINETNTFSDLVWIWDKEKLKSRDGDLVFFEKHGLDKLTPTDAMKPMYLWSMYGAYLGLQYPREFMTLHDVSFKAVDKEEWDRAYEFGVVSTPKQEGISVEEQTNEVRGSFYDFCSEYYPELMSLLFQK